MKKNLLYLKGQFLESGLIRESEINEIKKVKKHSKITPIMKQYLEIKKQAFDCIVFFQMGDFYEMFFEDAIVVSKLLSIQLTSRNKKKLNEVPMCGIPYHSLNIHISKIIKKNFKVAICDQIKDSKGPDGLVKRKVTRIVSPGTLIDPEYLSDYDHRFLTSVCFLKNEAGLAYLDLSSGEFKTCIVGSGTVLLEELKKLDSVELIVAKNQLSSLEFERVRNVTKLPYSVYDSRVPSYERARKILKDKLESNCEISELEVKAAAIVWSMVVSTQRCKPKHIKTIESYQLKKYMYLNATSVKSLELFKSIVDNDRKGSLLNAIDFTNTPMGSRLLKNWVCFPLLDLILIDMRQTAVSELCNEPFVSRFIRDTLSNSVDMSRLVGRICLKQTSHIELLLLGQILGSLPELSEKLLSMKSKILIDKGKTLWNKKIKKLWEKINSTINMNTFANFKTGGVIANGVSSELDELRLLIKDGRQWIADLQATLCEETKISSLKVKFNKVFGYCIEVTKKNSKKVPFNFIHKQTLSSIERYITIELKDYEDRILDAESKSLLLEEQLFEELRKKISDLSQELLICSDALASVDVLNGLAVLAVSWNYVRPSVFEEGDLKIEEGRHPVVEQMVPEGHFVPNNLLLDMHKQQILLVTGPNMAGKSTILRQTALIIILAQIGSFVPATKAKMPLIDGVFTRIGAMDDLAGGLSTFMVEMKETSRILSKITPRSLVILDEIGRGTGTFDGIAIAWAIVEYLYKFKNQGVKTLFATHYQELTGLILFSSRVKNFKVKVIKKGKELIFLYKFVPGASSDSYGILVANLAKIPTEVLDRAFEVFNILRRQEKKISLSSLLSQKEFKVEEEKNKVYNLADFDIYTYLSEIDLEKISSLESLDILRDIKKKVEIWNS